VSIRIEVLLVIGCGHISHLISFESHSCVDSASSQCNCIESVCFSGCGSAVLVEEVIRVVNGIIPDSEF